MALPAGVVTVKLQGTMNTDAIRAFLHAFRSLLLRPYTSSAAAHRSGSPAATSRSSCLIASCGLVANSRSSGIPASRRRGMSLAQRPGMYTSKSAQACPPGVT